MSFLSNVTVVCEFRAWLHGEVTDEAMGAIDRLFNNVEWFEMPGDSPSVEAAANVVKDKATQYANDMINEHVPLIKALRDGDDALDNPCKAVNAWLSLSKLDEALDVLEKDNLSGNINAANRAAALKAAGEALNAVGEVMSAVQVLKPFGEFLAAFVATAWAPFSEALGVYFERLEWISNVDPVTGEILGPQPG